MVFHREVYNFKNMSGVEVHLLDGPDLEVSLQRCARFNVCLCNAAGVALIAV